MKSGLPESLSGGLRECRTGFVIHMVLLFHRPFLVAAGEYMVIEGRNWVNCIMAIVTSQNMLQRALKNGYAVGAFNITNFMEMGALIEVAVQKRSPSLFKPRNASLDFLDRQRLWRSLTRWQSRRRSRSVCILTIVPMWDLPGYGLMPDIPALCSTPHKNPLRTISARRKKCVLTVILWEFRLKAN